jgi:hypothetical protein
MWAGPFSEMAGNSALVIHGKVKDYGKRLSHGDDLHESMQVEIVAVVKGEYKAKTITILGDRGADCRPYISPQAFAKNKEFLFALREPNKSTQPISVCGEYWIAIESGTANGTDLSETPAQHYSLPLETLLDQIAAGGHAQPESKPDTASSQTEDT